MSKRFTTCHVGTVGLIALGYLVLGWLGLQLAMPGTLISPIWPAAGLALVAVVCWPRSGFLGLVGGATLLHVIGPMAGFYDQGVGARYLATQLGMWYASGVVIQALFGARVFAQLLQKHGSAFDELGTILRCQIKVGLLASVINPLVIWVGMTVMRAEVGMPCATVVWVAWLGQAIGLAVALPLLMMSKAGLFTWRAWMQRFMMVTPLLAGLILVAWGYRYASQNYQQNTQVQFSTLSEKTFDQLQKAVDENQVALEMLAGLYCASEYVSRDEFSIFVPKELEIILEGTEVYWIPKVSNDAREQYELQAHQSGEYGFQFLEKVDGQLQTALIKNFYYPVYYRSLHTEDSLPLGLDLSGDSKLWQHILHAEFLSRASAIENQQYGTGEGVGRHVGGEAVLVGTQGAQWFNSEHDLLMIQPVYDPGISIQNDVPLDEVQSFNGFLVSKIPVESIVKAAGRLEDLRQLRVDVQPLMMNQVGLDCGVDWVAKSLQHAFDVVGAGVDRAHADGQIGCAVVGANIKQGIYQSVQPLEMGRWIWRCDIQASKAFIDAHGAWERWAIVVGGLIFISLLGSLFMVAVGRELSVSRQVEKQTRALATAHELLEKRYEHLKIAKHEATRQANLADQANQAKSDFLANISHEIRTPMAAILGYAELLEERHRSSKHQDSGELEVVDGLNPQQVANVIKKNANQLLELINDILDVSKIEAGRIELFPEAINPVEMTQQVFDLLRQQAFSKGLAFQMQVQENLPDEVVLDLTRLRQIVMNLLGNALKFTETGSVSVRISQVVDSGLAWLVWEVRDTGIGMTDAQQEIIFESFSQADSSITRRFGGTGLGLKISRSFAQMMGGGIEVNSVLGEGSCFSLKLPVLRSVQEALSLDTAAFTHQHAQTKHVDFGQIPGVMSDVEKRRLRSGLPLQDALVLVADDGVENQRLFKHYLTKAGAEVHVAADGLEAIEAVEKQHELGRPFDLVLMDVQMPNCDGYQATTKLRCKGFSLPIINMTAHTHESDRQKAFAAGCDDYMTKPVKRDAFIRCCLRWLVYQSHNAEPMNGSGI